MGEGANSPRQINQNVGGLMPYIDPVWRDRLERHPGELFTPGNLNYVLTLVIIDYMETNQLSYQTCNDIVGALECCKREFQRRIVDPYEDDAIQRNGDVYVPE